MKKLIISLLKISINLCFLTVLGINGGPNISLLFFGEPEYPIEALTKKLTETPKNFIK